MRKALFTRREKKEKRGCGVRLGEILKGKFMKFSFFPVQIRLPLEVEYRIIPKIGVYSLFAGPQRGTGRNGPVRGRKGEISIDTDHIQFLSRGDPVFEHHQGGGSC